MSEQKGNIGSVGSYDIQESISGESAVVAVNLGPVQVGVTLAISNQALIDLVKARIGNNVVGTLLSDLESALFPAPAAPAAPAAPSA